MLQAPDRKLRLYIPGNLSSSLKKFTNFHYEESDVENCHAILHNETITRNPSSSLPIEFVKYHTEKIQLLYKLNRISARYAGLNKKVIVLVAYDYEHRYPGFDNLIVLRFSMRSSGKQGNEFLVPFLFSCRVQPFPQSSETSIPHIGFCGWSKRRMGILTAFENSTEVHSVFVKRKHFWGGSRHDQELRNAFYNNMRDTQFNICQRGVGNYSMRFYQTLATGRIPVLVNTDLEFPFASEIHWRDFIVLENSEQACVDKVVECHRQGKVAEMQLKCGEVFHKYLSPRNFFAHLTEHLIPLLGCSDS
tara:strand:+ start:420 stop:1334 length:915 start_codon:yes stop_codon:yes gene_type:complete